MLKSEMSSYVLSQNMDPEKLKKLPITDHIIRIENSISTLVSTLNQDRQQMKQIKQFIILRTNKYRNDSTELMNTLKSETNKLKDMFNTSINTEKRQLLELKAEVQKIAGEHLKTEQGAFYTESKVNHCEGEIGFKELLKRK